jgi:nucleotidyltransferase/DNA polymerase involved in DNA repair
MHGWWGRKWSILRSIGCLSISTLISPRSNRSFAPSLSPSCPIRIEAQTGCCIAVSYQAKAYGVKTGFGVADAKLLCPHVILVEARPRLYVEYHHRIAAAIERCIPIQQVMSCDEFACQLSAASARCYAPPP